MWSHRISRFVAVGLALTLLGLIGLALYGVLRIRAAAESSARASAIAGAYIAAGEAIGDEVVGDEAVDKAGTGPDKHPSHDGLTASLWEADAMATAEDRAIADRVRKLHFAYHGAYARLADASKAGDRDRADAIARDEAEPLLRRLDAALTEATDAYEEVEAQEVAKLQKTVSMVSLAGVLAVPVSMALVAALTLDDHQVSALPGAAGVRVRAPGAARLADRAAQPGPVRRPPRPGAGRQPSRRIRPGRDAARPRPVQGGQRHARPRVRRRAAAPGRASGWARCCARPTPWPASPATSSPCCCPASTPPRRRELADRVLRELHRSFLLDDVTVDIEIEHRRGGRAGRTATRSRTIMR